mgnify:CR=1 FL=1
MSSNKKTIGKRMEELRKSKNWSAKQMGKKIGIDYRTVRRFETESQMPASDIIEAYSHIFHVSLDFLFYGTEITDLELLSAFKYLSPKQKKAVMMVIESYQ